MFPIDNALARSDSLGDGFFVGEGIAELPPSALILNSLQELCSFERSIFRLKSKDLRRAFPESPGAAPVIRVPVGVENGLYFFPCFFLNDLQQPFSPLQCIQRIN